MIHCFPSPDQPFFFHKKNIVANHKASGCTGNPSVLGQAYYCKISQHYVIGELHIKFLKDRCSSNTESRCDSCRRDWIGPVFSGLPEPASDYSRLPEYHHKGVFYTSMKKDNGIPRDVDDFLPRPNIMKCIEERSLKLEDEESIHKFCSVFITELEYVKKYIEHETNFKKAKQIRDKEKAKSWYERFPKIYSDYKWDELVKSEDKLNISVTELNKYLTYHKMSKEGDRMDKVRRIMTHRLSQNPAIFTSKNNSVSSGNTIAQSDTDNKNDKYIISESGIDDDEDEEEKGDNIAIFGTETDDDKCDEEMFWEQSNNLTEKQTRLGRIIRSRDVIGESFRY